MARRGNASDATNVANTFEIQIDQQITGNASDVYLVYPTFDLGSSDGSMGTIGSEDYTGHTGRRIQANTGSNTSQETTNYVWPGDSIRIWKSVIPTLTPTPTITRTPTTDALAHHDPLAHADSHADPGVMPRTGIDSQFTDGGIAIDPGATDIGNDGDNVDTQISLPFAYTFYGERTRPRT